MSSTGGHSIYDGQVGRISAAIQSNRTFLLLRDGTPYGSHSDGPRKPALLTTNKSHPAICAKTYNKRFFAATDFILARKFFIFLNSSYRFLEYGVSYYMVTGKDTFQYEHVESTAARSVHLV